MLLLSPFQVSLLSTVVQDLSPSNSPVLIASRQQQLHSSSRQWIRNELRNNSQRIRNEAVYMEVPRLGTVQKRWVRTERSNIFRPSQYIACTCTTSQLLCRNVKRRHVYQSTFSLQLQHFILFLTWLREVRTTMKHLLTVVCLKANLYIAA